MRSAMIAGLHGERMELVPTAGDQHGEGPAYRIRTPLASCDIHLDHGNRPKTGLVPLRVKLSRFTPVNFDRFVPV